YMQRWSLREIAAFLEVPVTTIKSRLRNARARLRKELQEMVHENLNTQPLPAEFAARVRERLIQAERLLSDRQWQEARSAYRQVLAEEPRNLTAHRGLYQ